MLFVRFTLTCMLNIHSNHQPRSQVLSPTRRETLVGSAHLSPRIWKIYKQTILGEGRISVRFVSTKRRRRGQWKLCIWSCLKDKTKRQNLGRRILWQRKHNFLLTIWMFVGCCKGIADSPLVQSKIFKAAVFVPKRTRLELSFLCYGGHLWESKCMYFQNYDYAVWRGPKRFIKRCRPHRTRKY